MRPAQVAAVAREIAARRGDRVRAVHQDGLLRWRVALDGRVGRIDVVLDLTPSFPRAHLADARPAPGAPSAFAAALRGHLGGARLQNARAIDGERALCVAFRRGDEDATLWFEGFGRGANLYLLDADGRVVLTPRGDVAGERDAAVGARFEAVPPRSEGVPSEDEGGSEAVAEAASAHEADAAAQQLRTRILRELRRLLARAERQVVKLGKMAERGERADGFRRQGELLRASFHLLEAGRTEVEVPDFDRDGELVAVPLNPRLAPGEQIGRLFREAKRAERAGEEATRRQPAASRLAEEIRKGLAAAESAPLDRAVLASLAASLGVDVGDPETMPKPRSKGPARARPWREYLSSEGWRILVGRDAKGNDQLTLREARPADLFLHVRGGTGSHVIVPTPRGKTVPRDTLLEAAELAVWFSDRRGTSVAEVDHTPRRYVRKPRKAPPGLVAVERAKTLTFRPNESRRKCVLATRQEPRVGGERPAK